ncbi:MAG: ABC transporter permease [Dehalococcoidia bacterium]|nr:ABC transporter permease [Dehalococcoidia bacterium]
MSNSQTTAAQLEWQSVAPATRKWGRQGWSGFLTRLLRDPRGAFSCAMLAILLLFAFVIPLVVPMSPFEIVRGERLLGPSVSHPFGTDELSRDLFIRNAVGLRATLVGGMLAVIGGWLCGITLGYVAGYRGGIVDTVISRCLDTLIAFPGILLAMILIAIFGGGLASLSLAVAVFNVPISARLARAAVLREGVRDYVLAARTVGCTGTRILWRHIAVNTFGLFAVQLPISVVNSVLVMAALGFLGLGEQPPNPTLGGLLNDGRRFMRLAWWYILAPASVLALLMLSLNFLSDVLSEMLDPVRRGKG